MNTLQKIFDSQVDKQFDKNIEEFLSKVIKEKFLEQRVNLTEEKILEITKKIREGKGNEIDIDILDDYLPMEMNSQDKEIIKNLKIDLSDIDTAELFNSLTSKLEKAYPKIITETSKHLFNRLKRQSSEEVKLLREERAAFQSRLEKFWRNPFVLFEMYLALIYEVGFECNKEYRKICANNPDVVFDVLIKLHARALQIGLEVLTLMKAGFADGAHARWRTLHEITVVGLFIEKHGKNTAERYYSHNYVESYKAALQHQQYAKALKQKGFSKKEMAKIKKEYDRVINKFGVSFKNSYGWASVALSKNNPTLADIENDVGLDKWRPYYKMASHNVHANPKGISFRLGLSDKSQKTILAGASDYGFADPAHGTAISLLQITSTFLVKVPNIDRLVMMDVLKTFEQLIGEEFLKTQKKYESKFLG